ncbi:MAG: ABC transporter permease [Paratractidigestivibacter faecalis]|uniref:ABC transporter permease n=1 Tax=Paratractidigestivibacter faecalis TaxID=2292441 RepID=UPI002A908D69|nr:ABC transporter permease [Paratractidigestivibacter faecalis]MDY6013467.1 ABC transporter permease [Paratractidigestivibacter faecalis]
MDQNTQGAAVSTKVHVGGRLSKDRYILQQLVTKDFKLRYRRSILGVVWSVLNPLLMMIIMSFVFQYFLRSNLEHYSLYLIVGNITFALMNDATNGGLRSIIDASSLLKKVKVDRWVFPVQKVFSAAVNFAFSLIAVAIVMVFDGVMPTIHVLWFVVGLVLVMLFSIGIGLFIGALAVFFRDMIHLWSVVLTAWTYLTPIFWDLSLLTNSNAPRIVVWIVKANPMYNYLEIMRSAFVYQNNPSVTVLALAAIWAVIALVIGIAVFKKTEHKFILYI